MATGDISASSVQAGCWKLKALGSLEVCCEQLLLLDSSEARNEGYETSWEVRIGQLSMF